MRPLRVRRASCCSSGAGIECTVMPSASAWRPASRADELEPDIKTRDEGAEGEPLEGIAVVLGNIEYGRRPVPLQAVGRRRRTVELHDDQRPQGQPGLAGIGGQVEILPDRAGGGRIELIQPCRCPGRCGLRRAPCPRAWPRPRAGCGLAHRAATSRAAPAPRRRRELQRRDDEEARASVHLPVVEIDAVCWSSQRPSSTTRRCTCSAAASRDRASCDACSAGKAPRAIRASCSRGLLRRALELPPAQARRGQCPHHAASSTTAARIDKRSAMLRNGARAAAAGPR